MPSFYLPPSITSWWKQLPSSPLITCCFVLPSGCPRERFNFAASTLQNMFLVWREWDQAKRKIRKHIWPIWKQVLFIGVDTRPFGRLFHLLKTIATIFILFRFFIEAASLCSNLDCTVPTTCTASGNNFGCRMGRPDRSGNQNTKHDG